MDKNLGIVTTLFLETCVPLQWGHVAITQMVNFLQFMNLFVFGTQQPREASAIRQAAVRVLDWPAPGPAAAQVPGQAAPPVADPRKPYQVRLQQHWADNNFANEDDALLWVQAYGQYMRDSTRDSAWDTTLGDMLLAIFAFSTQGTTTQKRITKFITELESNHAIRLDIDEDQVRLVFAYLSMALSEHLPELDAIVKCLHTISSMRQSIAKKPKKIRNRENKILTIFLPFPSLSLIHI